MKKISILDDSRVRPDKSGNLEKVDEVVNIPNLRMLGKVMIDWHVALGVFRDNIKTNEALLSIDYLAYDFDTGAMSSEEVYRLFRNMQNNCLIVGSKNHLKDKQDGKGIIERYHLIIPLSESITDNNNYKQIYKKYAELYKLPYDKACSNSSRYLYRHSCILYVYDSGTNLDTKRIQVLIDYDLRVQSVREHNRARYSVANNNSNNSLEAFKRTKAYKLLERGECFNDGNRYGTSSEIIGVMIKCQLTVDEALEIFDKYSSYGRSFTRESIIRRYRDWS